MLQARRSPVQVPDEVDFFNLPNLFSPGFDSASNRNEYLGVKKRATRYADNLAIIYEPNV
jgi:hypothetical protein